MEIIVYILIVLVLLVVIAGIIAPNSYEVNRSIIINRSISDTFQYLKLIRNQDEWSPWKKRDPDMEQSFVGTDGEVGFVSKWKGRKEVGEGEQEIINIIQNESIEVQLRFFKPWRSVSIGHLLVNEIDPDKTMVTWGFTGRNPFPFNIMMLFMSFDKAVGKDFEEGLESLKQVLEQ